MVGVRIHDQVTLDHHTVPETVVCPKMAGNWSHPTGLEDRSSVLVMLGSSLVMDHAVQPQPSTSGKTSYRAQRQSRPAPVQPSGANPPGRESSAALQTHAPGGARARTATRRVPHPRHPAASSQPPARLPHARCSGYESTSHVAPSSTARFPASCREKQTAPHP
jgi:hypothetical protein